MPVRRPVSAPPGTPDGLVLRVDERTLPDACASLAEADPALAALWERNGTAAAVAPRPRGFPTLVRLILEQQVSLASGRAAFERLAAGSAPSTPDHSSPSTTTSSVPSGSAGRRRVMSGCWPPPSTTDRSPSSTVARARRRRRRRGAARPHRRRPVDGRQLPPVRRPTGRRLAPRGPGAGGLPRSGDREPPSRPGTTTPTSWRSGGDRGGRWRRASCGTTTSVGLGTTPAEFS